MQTAITIRIQQLGQNVRAFRGNRFVSAGRFAGTVKGVACFESITVGDANDRRRGRTVSPDDLFGPFTVELFNDAGVKVGTVGVACMSDITKHPEGVPAMTA